MGHTVLMVSLATCYWYFPSMDTYIRRVVDAELDELLPDLPAIALEGPKGVGKTETAQRRCDRQFRLDNAAVLERVSADPKLLTSYAGLTLVDEWQRSPSSWDVVRRAVDDGIAGRSFLLTGSAIPITAPAHSGAGRIVSIRMRPMSLAERRPGSATVSLGRMLAGGRPVVEGVSEARLADYAADIVDSGFPGIRALRTERARRVALDSYLNRIVERDFPEQGLHTPRPQALRAWLAAYGAATATTASYNAILDAATPGESDKPSRSATERYRAVLESLWMLDPLPGWIPVGNPLGRLAAAPKHHLADPALAARAMGLTAKALVEATTPLAGQALGPLFESLVTLSARVYAQHSEAHVAHLRDRNGRHEIDLIIEGQDRRIVALEVKLSATVTDSDCAQLHWLENHIGTRLADAVIITTGPYAYRRPDGIAVIPAPLLGP